MSCSILRSERRWKPFKEEWRPFEDGELGVACCDRSTMLKASQRHLRSVRCAVLYPCSRDKGSVVDRSTKSTMPVELLVVGSCRAKNESQLVVRCLPYLNGALKGSYGGIVALCESPC